MASKTVLHRVCDVLADWLRGSVTIDPTLSRGEWKALLTAARVHGVGPRLATLVGGAAWVPPEVADWIDLEAELNRRRVDLLVEEGARILDAAASRAVEVLPLKGLALAAHLPSLRHRPMADLDLLVRPDHAAALEEVLLDLGYRCEVRKAKHDEYLPPGGRRVASRDHEHPDNPRPVEVHRRCGESFARTRTDLTEATWSSAAPGTIGGVGVPVPTVQAVWTHHLLHTAWQWLFGGGRMAQLLDLVELLPHVPDLDAALAPVDPRVALLALSPTERLLPSGLPAGLVEDLAHRAGGPSARLAVGLDPVQSSHLTPGGRILLLRVLRLHSGRPRALARGLGYTFAPAVDEMFINHDRVPRGAARFLAYPALWLWHVANLTGRG